MRILFIIILLVTVFLSPVFAQKDSSKTKLATTSLFKDSSNVQLKGDTAKKVIVDTTKVAAKKKHDPRIATFRSAVLPGWGQIYNREYWKLPIVYGALAIPASLYVYNNKYYRWMKFAYQAAYIAKYGTVDSLKYSPRTSADSILYYQINKKVLSKNTGQPLELSTYQQYRNIYKRDKDYSLLWFLILWGINVADATVFAHLKDFDVSDDLTLHVKPTYIPSTKVSGLSLVFSFKDPVHKPLPSF